MKWRRYKKLFKSKVRPRMIGLKVMVDGDGVPSGTMMTILDVSAKPVGGREVAFSVALDPHCEPIWDNAQTLIDSLEDKDNEDGFSLSFEIPNVKDLINDVM